MPNVEASLNERFADCANWLVNRVDGSKIADLNTADTDMLGTSTLTETETMLLLACQVGGCTVQWAMNKNSDGILTREMQVGLSICGG